MATTRVQALSSALLAAPEGRLAALPPCRLGCNSSSLASLTPSSLRLCSKEVLLSSRHSCLDHGALHVAAFASPAGSTLPDQASELVDQQRPISVGDVMTSSVLVTATITTTVDEALESLVENRITGMPVVDEANRVVGVVSDYDLLALDGIAGKINPEKGLFPEASSSWKTFKEIQKLLIKTQGKTVGDVMTPSPLVVRPLTNLEDAARLLLDSRFRRLPVVDETGKLVGILTRGNVVQAALQMKKKLEAAAKRSA